LLIIFPSIGSGEPAAPKKFSVPEKEYTLEEVASHNTKDSIWIAVKGVVLDLTNWVDEHPVGGQSLLTS
jgi:cytochrome b involved in lipid metabolism